MPAPFGQVQLGQRGFSSRLAALGFVDVELRGVADRGLNGLGAVPLDDGW